MKQLLLSILMPLLWATPVVLILYFASQVIPTVHDLALYGLIGYLMYHKRDADE